MKECKIALLGNPNVGKSTLFNRLTGLKQKIGNYAGTTVEKKIGFTQVADQKFKIYDYPGTQSLYPKSKDEEVVFDILSNPSHPDFPDKAVVVGSPLQLKRSLLLYHQVRDLGIPVLFVLNMVDEAERKHITVNKTALKSHIGSQVFALNARSGQGVAELKAHFLHDFPTFSEPSYLIERSFTAAVNDLQSRFQLPNAYIAWQFLVQPHLEHLSEDDNQYIDSVRTLNQWIPGRLQVKETLERYKEIEPLVEEIVIHPETAHQSLSDKADAILTHPLWGYVIFFGLLFLIFQAIYTWSSYPMDLIDGTFGDLQTWAQEILPSGPFTSLLVDGVIPGLGGIVIFVPQIAILFFFLLIMEESGYMSRVVFLMDKWMRPFGLSGKSVVPLMSGAACAIPAILSARNIENNKERLITILVTPFMTCSARLPVYAILIALVIPENTFWGFNWQGIALFTLYALGVVAALGFAWIFKLFLKSSYKSYLIMEMPSYKFPDAKNLLWGIWEKSSAFLFGAGKMILAMSILLWALSVWGPGEKFANAENYIATQAKAQQWNETEQENNLAAYKLEHSLLGYVGKGIEPVFRPLGYDWKISIGVLSSFAAREVFVGTMATLYSLGSNDEETKVVQRMRKETNVFGKPVFDLPTGVSLMLFYAFAMQCVSTMAIVKTETNSWKWPLVQFFLMGGFAYLVSFIAYQSLI